MDAVNAAAFAEISEVGLRGASMDRIAHRAGTGKAALYRRWPNVRALALDLFISTLDNALPAANPDTGSLRNDLVTSLSISEAAHDPAVSVEFQSRFGIRKQVEAMAMLQQGVARGEIPMQSIDPWVLQVPAALIVHHVIMTGAAPTPADIEHIVDAIVLPLLKNPAT